MPRSKIKTDDNGQNKVRKRAPGGGRKPAPIDLAEAERVAALGPTARLLAQYFKVDEKTLERRIRKHYNLTPTEFIAQRVAPKKIELLSVSLDEAIVKRNPTLIIFLLKNYLDFSDRREIKQEIKQTENQQTVKVVLPGQVQEQVRKLEEVADKTLTPQQKEKLG